MINNLAFDKYFFSRKGSHLSVDAHKGGFKVTSVRNVISDVNNMFFVAFEETPEISFLPWELTATTFRTQISVCLSVRITFGSKEKGEV